MGKVLVIRKEAAPAEGGGGGLGVGIGGGGLMFMLGQGRMMTPEQLTEAGFGEEGSESHDRAIHMQGVGRKLRYATAGLGAFNSLYDLTSSGGTGIGRALATGAMGGYAGTAGAEDVTARMDQRFGEMMGRAPSVIAPPVIASPTPTGSVDVYDSNKRMGDLMEYYAEEEDPRMADIGRNF